MTGVAPVTAESDAPKSAPWDTLNLFLTAFLLTLVVALCVAWLSVLPDGSYGCLEEMSKPEVKWYNSIMALGSSSLMVWHYLDSDPMLVRYTVLGRPEFPAVHREFMGLRRWSTFTAWSNFSCAVFFGCAAALGWSTVPPKSLCVVTQLLWELMFPLGFFVNIVVSFVLIPQIKKMRDWQKLKRILRPKPQLLHNGLALAGAVEAMLATPPLLLMHFPVLVLFGCMYITFAWYWFFQSGIFHYMFLDYRFKYEPLALIGLLLLLAFVYLLASVAVHMASEHWPARLAIGLAALATCTWTPGKMDNNDSSAALLSS